MCQSTREALRRCMTPLSRCDTQRPDESFPRQRVQDLFEADDGQRLRELAGCKCGVFRGCASRQSPAFDENIIRVVRGIGYEEGETYLVVLAFLCFVERMDLIHRFVEKSYSDQWLHEHPLERQQLDELFSSPESDGQTYSAHIEFDFFRFFLPTIHGPERQQKFLSMQTLPLKIMERKGGGGYGVVYQAKMLDGGYCKFVDVKDGLFALKRYTNPVVSDAEADWEKEWRNNVVYNKHPHINPILASIAHGDVYMNFYSLCEGDLQRLFAKDPSPEDHGAKSIWRQYMGLLSALNYIHCSQPTQFGYHFDIKTLNILVLLGRWMIADLGLLHRKNNESGMLSATPRRPGCQEFGGPETKVTRKFDVWGIGCVGCIALVWLRKGARGVENFREDRRQEVVQMGMTSILYNFYCETPSGPQLHKEVDKLLLEASDEDDLSKGVAGILRDMLSIEVDARPTAKEAEERLAKVLGVEPLDVPKLPLGFQSQPASAQLAVPGGVLGPVKPLHSQAQSIGDEVIVSVKLPSMEHPGASVEFTFSPGTGDEPLSSVTVSTTPTFSMAESVPVPGCLTQRSQDPPHEHAMRMPGEWPYEADHDYDAASVEPSGCSLGTPQWPFSSVTMACNLLLRKVRLRRQSTQHSPKSIAAASGVDP